MVTTTLKRKKGQKHLKFYKTLNRNPKIIQLIQVITNTEKKLNRLQTKSEKAELRRIKKQAIVILKDLGEEHLQL